MSYRLVPDGGSGEMQRSGDGSAGGGGVTAPGPKSLLGISCRDGSALSPQKLPDPWPTKLSLNPHRVPTILAPEICPSGCSPCWSCGVGRGASLEGAWFESQTVGQDTLWCAVGWGLLALT